MDTCACDDDSDREKPPDGYVPGWKRATTYAQHVSTYLLFGPYLCVSLFSCVADTGSPVKLADANLMNTMYTEHRCSWGYVSTHLRAFCFRVTGQLRFYKLNLAIGSIPATDVGMASPRRCCRLSILQIHGSLRSSRNVILAMFLESGGFACYRVHRQEASADPELSTQRPPFAAERHHSEQNE
jgi:hypothetical protein